MPTVRLPAVLDPATAGVRSVTVQGDTLAAVFDDLFRQLPALRVHVVDESGGLRRHVACLHEGVNRRRLDTPVAADDEIVLLQGISGG
jgi:molybdopterin converting factor small subunit